jgi:hypothetical protein
MAQSNLLIARKIKWKEFFKKKLERHLTHPINSKHNRVDIFMKSKELIREISSFQNEQNKTRVNRGTHFGYLDLFE